MKYIRKDERIIVDKQKEREEAKINDFLKRFIKIRINFQKFNK